MHGDLEKAIDGLGLSDKVPTLQENATRSEEFISESRAFLQKQNDPTNVPLDVVVLGSLARYEASTLSDFDYLIVVHQLPDQVTQSRALISSVNELYSQRLKLEAPGRTRTFGRVVAAPSLTETIGLEDDTNRSHTHRILLLAESVSLYRPDLHEKLLCRILERYFADYEFPKVGVPRFLLNDFLRYWRTVAVDYQAKRWEQFHSEWGLRYLKLLISRKLAFVGSIAPLFLCEECTTEYFLQQFQKPALARFAELYGRIEQAFYDDLRSVFLISEEFAKALASSEFRAEANAIQSRRDIKPNSFEKMRLNGVKMQHNLERIFFESDVLREKAVRYLSF